MDDLSDWDRLDAAAFRVSMKRSVRRLGWILALIGAIVAACGVAGGLVPLAALGLVLVGAGLWNLSRPAVTGLIVDGITVILTGVFNGVAWLWIDDARPSALLKWVVAGLVQIVWGARRLALYRIARRSRNDCPAIERLERIVRDVAGRDARTDRSVAEFRTGRFVKRRNRLGLEAEGAVGLLEQQAVRLEKRSDIWIEARGTTSLGRSIKVRVRMGDLELLGRMPVDHFERFEQWKLGLSQAPSIAA